MLRTARATSLVDRWSRLWVAGILAAQVADTSPVVKKTTAAATASRWLLRTEHSQRDDDPKREYG